MNVISKKCLLRGVGSVLEVYPPNVTRKRRVRALKAQKANAGGQSLDGMRLQADWYRVGEYLKHAVRSYDQEQRGCS